jgi:hypothetical protein
MQNAIVGLLSGTARGRVFSSTRALDTAELVEELQAAGFVTTEKHRQALATVRRACASLVRRGILAGRYVVSGNPPHGETTSWTIASHEREERPGPASGTPPG